MSSLATAAELRFDPGADPAAVERFWREYLRWSEQREITVEEAQRLHHDFQHPHGGASWLAYEGADAIAHLRQNSCPAWFAGVPQPASWWQGFAALPGPGGEPRGDLAGLLSLRALAQPGGHALLGTPGLDSRVVHMYRRMRFHYWGAVPFLFLVVDGAAVLRELSLFRRRPGAGGLATVASRLWLPGKILELRHRRLPEKEPLQVATVDSFPPEVDRLWEEVRSRFALVFNRSRAYLEWRFAGSGYRKVICYEGTRACGWYVLKLRAMPAHRHFGSLRVGSVVDLLADPADQRLAADMLRSAVEQLRAEGAQLIVGNLSHRTFLAAARAAGFAQGPSNFHFFTRKLPTVPLAEAHLTRGDSDGDVNL